MRSLHAGFFVLQNRIRTLGPVSRVHVAAVEFVCVDPSTTLIAESWPCP